MIKETKDIYYLNTLTDYKITLNDFNKILIYIIGEKIVGFIDYSNIYERMEINYIYVLPECRNNGVAYNLINYIINNNKFSNITLEVKVTNIPAINLYKKFDFEVVAIRKKYYNGVDAYLMERK